MVLSGPLAMAASDAVITLVAFSASFRLGTVFYSRFLCRESEPRQYVGCLSFFLLNTGAVHSSRLRSVSRHRARMRCAPTFAAALLARCLLLTALLMSS